MKTKFILHGGASSRKTPDNEKFYSEIVNSADKDTVNILCVYFARPEHRWDESFYEDKYSFENVDTNKTLKIQMAAYEDFRDQLTNYDVIFINGGFKGHLKETIESVGNFREFIKGKTVVGISAGANILATYYFSQAIDGIIEGTAILPIKVFCHFDENLSSELKKLETYKEHLPLYKIPEEKFITLEN